jgi:hypothetical protein
MKQATRQKYPRGWNRKKVRDLIAYYDRQTEEEGAREIETAPAAPGEIWMSVPTDLVPAITQLIENHKPRTANRRTRRRQVHKAL